MCGALDVELWCNLTLVFALLFHLLTDMLVKTVEKMFKDYLNSNVRIIHVFSLHADKVQVLAFY